MTAIPPQYHRNPLPSWIKDEGTLPIIYGTAWTTSGYWLLIASILFHLYVTKAAGHYIWALATCALLLILMGLYQRVWLTPTGVAWRTIRGKGWVHWKEIDSITEVIGCRFVPIVGIEGRTFFLPLEEGDLTKVRSFMASRPTKAEPLAVPATTTVPTGEVKTAKLLFNASVPFLLLGSDTTSVPFGLTALNSAMQIFGLMMAGLSVLIIVLGLTSRWSRTIEITEEGLTVRSGSRRSFITFSDVRRAELTRVMGSPRHLTLDSVSSGLSLPYEMAGFEKWKDAIAARLPDGVVIK